MELGKETSGRSENPYERPYDRLWSCAFVYELPAQARDWFYSVGLVRANLDESEHPAYCRSERGKIEVSVYRMGEVIESIGVAIQTAEAALKAGGFRDHRLLDFRCADVEEERRRSMCESEPQGAETNKLESGRTVVAAI